MKKIDEYKIGDAVILTMTGMTTRLRAKCISTKQEPKGGYPEDDHPRFEVTDNYKLSGGSVLKPGDYIIMKDLSDG
jgi:hypothetical protein